MSEQFTQRIESYLEHHPDAVVDPAKAEVMAYASKLEEERVSDLGNKTIEYALAAATKVHPHGRRMTTLGEIKDTEKKVTEYEEKTKSSRVKADEQASSAGDLYDRISSLKSGSNGSS